MTFTLSFPVYTPQEELPVDFPPVALTAPPLTARGPSLQKIPWVGLPVVSPPLAVTLPALTLTPFVV